ncbi:hypothetical protein NQ176_g4952 [Zarea fungicola]|uniref:Uncharacterized protein n=1 Tax=Zarea fungicola TaxID=93591 RepID=A0ACC1NDF0_9HYPO|nr:hypothetical protein NQ176_g4952 [Lecanicillium fungicola]
MATMSVKYNKKRDTEINLQDAKAKDPPLAGEVVQINYSKQPTGPSAPKRLKKKHDLTVATTDPQLTKNNEASITVAPVAPKLPWDTYQKLFDLQLGDSDYFTVAEKKAPDPDRNPVVIIKTLTGPGAEIRAQVIKSIRHNRFVEPLLFFSIDTGYLVSFEFMPMALCEIAGSPLLNDLRMASAVGQIVDALVYLEQNGLDHRGVTCSNALMDCFGNIKLWAQEQIQTSIGACPHAKAVGEIIMYLAHGMARDDGIVGLDDPHRFPLAFDFLSATQTTSTIAAITDNPLLKLPWHKNRLAGLISLTQTWVGRGYRFPAVAADNI